MRQKKIPTLLGLILVIAIVVSFRFAYDLITPLLSRAGPTVSPRNITVTNISDTAFTVTWTTDVAVPGALVLEQTPKITVFDERDAQSSDTTTPRTTHSVTVRNIKPDSDYHVSILSDGKPYDGQTEPFIVRTGPTLDGFGSSLEPAYGQATLPSGQPAEGAIVYLTLNTGQTLSTLVSETGSWVIPLHHVRTGDVSAYLPAAERINMNIVIRTHDDQATAETDTLNDNPVPTMTIGKTYDFKKIQAENLTKPSLAQQHTNPSRVLGSQTSTTHTIAITQPKDGSAISSNLPLFQGSGIPGKRVLILIGISRPISATTTVGADGLWRYTPSTPLSAGKQSVTITTTDASEKSVAITHTFEIFKSGTQVLGDATASATLAPTATPTVYNAATSSPTPTTDLSGDPMPVTGFPLPLIVSLIAGGLFILSGAALITHKTYEN